MKSLSYRQICLVTSTTLPTPLVDKISSFAAVFHLNSQKLILPMKCVSKVVEGTAVAVNRRFSH